MMSLAVPCCTLVIFADDWFSFFKKKGFILLIYDGIVHCLYECTMYTVFQKIISNWFCCLHMSILDVCTATEGGYIGTATLH